jgi:hypothetical protein
MPLCPKSSRGISCLVLPSVLRTGPPIYFLMVFTPRYAFLIYHIQSKLLKDMLKTGSPEGTGHYQHRFIETAINYTLFDVKVKSTPIGVTHAALFKPMPLETIALICGVVSARLYRDK